MPLPPQTPTRTRLLLAGMCAVFFGLSLGLSAPVHAEPGEGQEARAPAEPGDAVLQLLQDRGLLPTAKQLDDHTLVQQVRDTASDLVMQAMHFLGVPYRRGGNTAEQGFDCSGFTRHVFENSIGLVLPRRADQQAKSSSLQAVKREQLRPGDLVFFNTMRRAFSHVGIYIGEGKFIHAPRTGGEVRVEDMRQAYWTQRFNGARRAELTAVQAQQGVASPK